LVELGGNVARTRATYGICDEDTYNFDETGFVMGKIMAQLVVTGSERRGQPKAIQPGNREWVTVIQGINAVGWAIPPFGILANDQSITKENMCASFRGAGLVPYDPEMVISKLVMKLRTLARYVARHAG
jgi:hypothetical protein